MLNFSAGMNANEGHKVGRVREYSEFEESVSDLKLDRENLLRALADLHKLLEDYAPTWYTMPHREQAESALQGRKG